MWAGQPPQVPNQSQQVVQATLQPKGLCCSEAPTCKSCEEQQRMEAYKTVSCLERGVLELLLFCYSLMSHLCLT